MNRNAGWFRFYERMIDSPQVLELDDAEFRLLIGLWSLASAQPERGTLPYSAKALQRRLIPTCGVEDVDRMLSHLTAVGMIAPATSGSGYVVTNWDELVPPRPDDGRLPLAEWRVIRAVVFARDDYTCQYCGARGVSLQADHIYPVSRGGRNDLDNLATACKPCNQSKRAKTLEEWLP